MSSVGAEFSDGFQQLHVAGSDPVTIESVNVEGGTDALETIGVSVGQPGRPDDFFVSMPGYPPSGVPPQFVVPGEGAVLEPGSSYQLIVGYRVRDLVMDKQTAVIVSYSVDGDDYEVELPSGLVTCPPPLTDTECAKQAHATFAS